MADSTIGRLIGLGLDAPDPLRYNGGAVSGASLYRLIGQPLSAPYFGFSGNYKIAGTTTDSGVPASRRVLVLPHYAPNVIRDITSVAVSGVWSAENLAPGKYLVVGMDVSGVHNSVSYDFIDAVAM